MAADAEEQLRHGTIAEIDEVCAVERGTVGQRIGQIEAEGQLALEPRLDGVPVGRNDLRWLVRGECCDMQVASLCDEHSATGCGRITRLIERSGEAADHKQHYGC